MNSADGQQPDSLAAGNHVRFGGWSDYREWADHDFRPRGPVDEKSSRISWVPAMTRLVELAPISQPESDARTVCLLAPSVEEWQVSLDADDIDVDYDLSFDVDSEDRLVRPYVRAGGRARTTHDLEFETVVSTTGLHRSWDGELTDDQRRICAECESPRSVAEIAVGIEAAIGVTMVLIGDAIDQGLLLVHERTPIVRGRPPLELLARLRGGIANLA